MKRQVLFFIFIILLFKYTSAQVDKTNVYDYWSYYRGVNNILYKNICDVALEQLKERKLYLRTIEDKTLYPSLIEKKLKKSIGNFPYKTPLNAVVTNKIKKENYTIENLYFESRPGYYVTASLFIPQKSKGKRPAILYCCGHSTDGYRGKGYQRMILNLVDKGFVVLAFDPIGQGERIQYFDSIGNNIYGPTHEHSYPGTQSFISGLSPANYFIWDGIRAVDYLISRKEVDTGNIGITGRSGGGTQTACIAAMDDRIKVAAPECYLTSYKMLLKSRGPQDAEQILMNFIADGLDISDLIHVRAPKPTLMITTTQDIFSIQGARDVFSEAKSVYEAFGLSNNIQMIEDDAGHSSTLKNRERTYAFFQEHLNNPGSAQETEVSFLDADELRVSFNDQGEKTINSKTLYDLNKEYSTTLSAGLEESRLNYTDFLNKLKSKIEQKTGFTYNQKDREYIFSGRSRTENYSIEKYLVKGGSDYYIPLLRLLPDTPVKQTILLLDNNGKSHAFHKGIAKNLVSRGFELIIPDLSGYGELGGGYIGGDAVIQDVPLNIWYAGVLTGKTPLAVRMEEIISVIDFIEDIHGEKSTNLAAFAFGELASDLLHTACFDKRIEQLIVSEPLFSYASIVEERNYRTKFIMSMPPGVVGSYDVSDLISFISPRKVLMVNPVDATGQKMETSKLQPFYQSIFKHNKEEGYSQSFEIIESDSSDFIPKVFGF